MVAAGRLARGVWETLGEEISAWCAGRSWLARAPLVLWFAWIGAAPSGGPALREPLRRAQPGAARGRAPPLLVVRAVPGGRRRHAPAARGARSCRRRCSPASPTGSRCPSAAPGSPRTCTTSRPTWATPARWSCRSSRSAAASRWSRTTGTTCWARSGCCGWDTFLAGGVRVVAFVVLWGSLAAAVWMLVRMARAPAAR